ncbi:hypothetical protein CDD81_6500 [Ophiocordyceps australis]|uniref:Uncharacterized protein n=1 Tax=Ophiocordyceps australis TaxID=1399860 RepID=A0A2C5YGB8_9HYPO|nr:hypothetical protein CDD81_6500 [Ophiocordyceps australis]
MGNEKESDCVSFRDWLLSMYPAVVKKTSQFKGNNACDHYKAILMTISCGHLKNMSLGFKLRGEDRSGTYDIIKMFLHGSAGSAEVKVAYKPAEGFHDWFPVDLPSHFNSDTIGIGALDTANLTCAATWLKDWVSNDAWYFQGFKLKAQCNNTDTTVEIDKYASVNEWYQHMNNHWHWQQVKDDVVASFPLSPGYWKRTEDDGLGGEKTVLEERCWSNISSFLLCLKELNPV